MNKGDCFFEIKGIVVKVRKILKDKKLLHLFKNTQISLVFTNDISYCSTTSDINLYSTWAVEYKNGRLRTGAKININTIILK